MEDREARREQEEKLAWDIGFAIWRSRALPSKDRSIERFQGVAKSVVAHLRLSAWTFKNRPQQTPHSAGQTVSNDRSSDDG